MDSVILPAGVIDPDVVLRGLDPPIPYEQRDGQHVVPNGMGVAAQAALDAAADRRPAYRVAAKRALRRHLREQIIDVVAEDDRVVVATAALTLINNRRARGQSLTADMLTIETMAVGLLQDKLAPLKKLLDAEAAVDGMTDARELYDLAARPESWAGWST